ncbi:MAG: GNAT family N-acetyltransferase [Bauldia sp.]|nr:GNAT family N-acetyltransferase [Bauldia sp.]
MANLAFHPVDATTLPAFEAFFDAVGAPKFCWCMAFRRTPDEVKVASSANSRRQMLGRIRDGVPVGLLAVENGETVGWVSVAPRATFRNLKGPPETEGESVWSISCFFVPRSRRGEGLSRKLIAGAVAHARANGATVVEAYPVAPDSPSYRHMGFVPVFAAAGFTDLGKAGKRRHVMRLALPSADGPGAARRARSNRPA